MAERQHGFCPPGDAGLRLGRRIIRCATLAASLWLVTSSAAHAQGTCNFDELPGAVLRLAADCVTDVSIVIPDGFTLDGAGRTIMAVDPAGGVFQGGIITNGGAAASVIDVTIVASLRAAGACPTGASRLRGIYFEGASGAIRDTVVLGVTRAPATCQEGNAIDVRNRRDASDATYVEITGNVVDGYQKTGIVVSGSVDALIRGNEVGASAAQAFLPANAVQVGDGASATIAGNDITGNSWPHPSAAATGILLAGSAPGTVVRDNLVTGDADVGIYVLASGAIVVQNVVEDEGPDGFYDVGIGNYGDGNLFVGNIVRGFRTETQGVSRSGVRVASVSR